MYDGQTDLPEPDVALAAATLARAQTAHRAVRIHSKIDWAREQIAELEPFEFERTIGSNAVFAPATPPANDAPSVDPFTSWINCESVGLWKPSNPFHGDGTIHLNTTVDSSKVREMPIIADDLTTAGCNGTLTTDTLSLRWRSGLRYINPRLF